ncbi:Beta-galactosidase 8 [Salvia divinorum]|uniref:Beta-galactosidase 8 n=1 Tax=Salvia divinorum TaxID=28513 RepID=A0ABD1GBX7_SALDI
MGLLMLIGPEIQMIGNQLWGISRLCEGTLSLDEVKKKRVVALSSAEAEFQGIKSGLTEILWLKKFMTELGSLSHKTCKFFCDNKATISIAENPVQHDRTKHVEVDRHFIKENIEAKLVELPFVRSTDQLADILTKAVDTKNFREVLDKLRIRDLIA